MSLKPEVLAAARLLSEDALQHGATAAILFGSRARGVSYPESDVDLAFVGPDREGTLVRKHGYLFSLDWCSVEKFHDAMHSPASAGGTVPGLRACFIVADPQGIASRLKTDAQTWTWDSISSKCDLWVPEQIASLAEDVQRAFGHQKLGKRWMANVLKGMLAARLGMILAVHLRILYNSENELWDLVYGAMGQPWTATQSAAFATADETYAESFEATMKLYALAVAKVYHIMDPRQRGVVAGTLEIIGHRGMVNA